VPARLASGGEVFLRGQPCATERQRPADVPHRHFAHRREDPPKAAILFAFRAGFFSPNILFAWANATRELNFSFPLAYP
jgi:hypothetical protein